jgi:hypothetical protein
MKHHVATLKHRSTCDNEMNVVMLCNANAQMQAKPLWCYIHTLLRLLHGCHRHQQHLPDWRRGRPGATPARLWHDASQPLAPRPKGKGLLRHYLQGSPMSANTTKGTPVSLWLNSSRAKGWRSFWLTSTPLGGDVSGLASQTPATPHWRVAVSSPPSARRAQTAWSSLCHRTVQIIRAQVQKQLLEKSNFRTWAHIILIVHEIRKDFKPTNQ